MLLLAMEVTAAAVPTAPAAVPMEAAVALVVRTMADAELKAAVMAPVAPAAAAPAAVAAETAATPVATPEKRAGKKARKTMVTSF